MSKSKRKFKFRMHPMFGWALIIFVLLGFGLWLVGSVIWADLPSNSLGLSANFKIYIKNKNILAIAWGSAGIGTIAFIIYYLDQLGWNHPQKVRSGKVFGTSKLLGNNEINKITSRSVYGSKHQVGWVVKTSHAKKKLIFNTAKVSHALVVGSTGSGKTENVVLPNILYNMTSTERPSMIVSDPKSAIYKRLKETITKTKYNTYVLDFDKFKGNKWNPFVKIKTAWNKGHTGEAERLIDTLINSIVSVPQGRTDPFWSQSAKRLIKRVILAILVQDQLENKNNNLITP